MALTEAEELELLELEEQESLSSQPQVNNLESNAIPVATQALEDVGRTTLDVMRGSPEAVSNVSTNINKVVSPLYQENTILTKGRDITKNALFPNNNSMISNVGRKATDFLFPTTPVGAGLATIGTQAGQKVVGNVVEAAGDILNKDIGKVGNAVKSTSDILKGIPKTFSTEKQIELWNKTKNEMFASRGSMIDKYGTELENAVKSNPKATVNLKQVIDDIKIEDGAGLLDPKVKNAINTVPKLKALYENPDMATNINAKQAQEILNGISSKFPESKLSGSSLFRSSDYALKSLKNEIRAAQVDAYPDMIPVKKEYGEFSNAYKGMKNEVLSKHFFENLDRNFNNPIVKTYIDRVLPKEAVRELGGYRIAAKAIKWGKIAAGTAILGGVAKETFK